MFDNFGFEYNEKNKFIKEYESNIKNIFVKIKN